MRATSSNRSGSNVFRCTPRGRLDSAWSSNNASRPEPALDPCDEDRDDLDTDDIVSHSDPQTFSALPRECLCFSFGTESPAKRCRANWSPLRAAATSFESSCSVKLGMVGAEKTGRFSSTNNDCFRMADVNVPWGANVESWFLIRGRDEEDRVEEETDSGVPGGGELRVEASEFSKGDEGG
jgi:hypothetical protein